MSQETGMRTIRYTHFDFAGEVKKKAALSDFFLSYFQLIVHDVIAPFAVANQVLKLGESGGGMSPGIAWTPFEISRAEYEAVIEENLSVYMGHTYDTPEGCDFFISDLFEIRSKREIH